MMRCIHLHGALGAKYGRTLRFDVATAGEAVRALCANYPGIMKDLRDGSWHVVRGKKLKDGFSLGEEDIAGFHLGAADLHIAPVARGSKRNGLLKIILGVALVGVAFAFSGGALATPIMGGGGLLGGITYGNLAMVGAATALAGVSSLLSPEDKAKDDNENSFTFSGPGNAYTQGSPVPLVYGEVITGGVMVSGGVDVERIAVNGPASYGGKGKGGGGK